jgi:hypothetical protein
MFALDYSSVFIFLSFVTLGFPKYFSPENICVCSSFSHNSVFIQEPC